MGIGRIIAGLSAAIVAVEGISAVATGPSKLLRPPGSQSESDFMSRCTRCGKCIEACKYKALKPADSFSGAAAGTPTLDVEVQACHLCEDFPCVNACPTGALRDVVTRSDVNMGYAVINEDTCIAFKGMRCEVCYRVCPLIDQAITIENDMLEGDSIHARFIPTINKDVCTGCGLCVQRCVVRDPKVPIRIRSIAEQELSGK